VLRGPRKAEFGQVWIVGGVTVGAAVVLGSKGWGGDLSRDEAIYAYAGQQLAHGVPPYASIFDPKGPVAAFLAAIGAKLGSATGHAELTGIRLIYGALACLVVAAVYLLARKTWNSTLAGLVASLAICCLPSFATNAFSGPEAHDPALLFLVLTLWLALERRWWVAGVCGGLAILAWQPLVLVLVVVLAGACVAEPGHDGDTRFRRARGMLLGVAATLVACLVFFVVTRTVGVAFDATVRFPLEGIEHGHDTLGGRLHAMVSAGSADGVARAVLWWLCVLALVVMLVRHVMATARGGSWSRLVRDPVTVFVLAPAVVLFGYCLTDFQGPPDLLPLLPFGAIGVGGLVVALQHAMAPERVGRVLSAAVVVALALGSFLLPTGERGGLACERLQAQALREAVAPGSTLWSFGDPSPLVLTQRRNPDRFLYLASGAADWKVRGLAGGLREWEADIRRVSPDVVVFGGYQQGHIHDSLVSWFLRNGYRRTRVGPWQVYLLPDAHLRPGLAAECGRVV
jgi:hypothetical protein